MPAKHNIDKEAQLIITTWHGEARDIDFLKAIKEYQQNIQNHPDHIDYNEVLDLTNLSHFQLTTEGIKKIGLIASSSDQDDVDRKLAIIVNSNLVFGFAKMYTAYRNLSKQSSKKIHVFKSQTKAFEWVQDKH